MVRAGSLGWTGPARSTPCAWSTSEGRIVEGRRYRHDERGIRALCARLVELGVALVAIERPDGLLIERLLDAGLRGDRGASQPGRRDATAVQRRGRQVGQLRRFVLAELARTDSHRFRVLVPDSDETKALRALTRAREDLVEHARRAGQPAARPARLLLARRQQGVRRGRLADRAGVPQALPDPADARGLGEQRLAASSPATATAAASPPASCSTRLRNAAQRPRRRARDGSPPPDRARARRRARADRRADQRS